MNFSISRTATDESAFFSYDFHLSIEHLLGHWILDILLVLKVIATNFANSSWIRHFGTFDGESILLVLTITYHRLSIILELRSGRIRSCEMRKTHDQPISILKLDFPWTCRLYGRAIRRQLFYYLKVLHIFKSPNPRFLQFIWKRLQ